MYSMILCVSRDGSCFLLLTFDRWLTLSYGIVFLQIGGVFYHQINVYEQLFEEIDKFIQSKIPEDDHADITIRFMTTYFVAAEIRNRRIRIRNRLIHKSEGISIHLTRYRMKLITFGFIWSRYLVNFISIGLSYNGMQ